MPEMTMEQANMIAHALGDPWSTGQKHGFRYRNHYIGAEPALDAAVAEGWATKHNGGQWSGGSPFYRITPAGEAALDDFLAHRRKGGDPVSAKGGDPVIAAITLPCDTDAGDTVTLDRVGGCAALTTKAKGGQVNLTPADARKAAAWLVACADEIEASIARVRAEREEVVL